MFGVWLRNRRRKKILAQPFPDTWLEHLHSYVRHYQYLDEDAQKRVRQVTQVMVAEQLWTAGVDLTVTDEMKVAVAGQAALLTLGQNEPYFFDRVTTIIIHPRAFDHETYRPAAEHDYSLAGQAWHRGPIVLSWQHVLDGGRRPSDGFNVVLHEFAHYIDGLNGDYSGMPPLDDHDDRCRWYDVTEREFLRLVGSAQRGDATLLDHYGATNKAEFFAVATECFFEQPHAMHERHQDLHEVLSGFYRVDPRQWMPNTPLEKANEEGQEAEDRFALPAEVLRSNNPDELFTAGLEALDAWADEEALKALDRALQLNPNDEEALEHRARTHLLMKNYRQAIADCDLALTVAPNDLEALETRAAALLHLDQLEEALELINFVLGEDWGRAEAYHIRGRVWLALNRPRKALADFTSAIKRELYWADAYYHRSLAYRALGKTRKADADLQRALQLDPLVESRGMRGEEGSRPKDQ